MKSNKQPYDLTAALSQASQKPIRLEVVREAPKSVVPERPVARPSHKPGGWRQYLLCGLPILGIAAICVVAFFGPRMLAGYDSESSESYKSFSCKQPVKKAAKGKYEQQVRIQRGPAAWVSLTGDQNPAVGLKPQVKVAPAPAKVRVKTPAKESAPKNEAETEAEAASERGEAGGEAPAEAAPLSDTRKAIAPIRVRVTIPGLWQRKVKVGKREFTAIEMPGHSFGGEVGQAELPTLLATFEIPHGVDVFGDVTPGKPRELGKGYKIIPRQPPQPDTIGAKPAPFAVDEEYYCGKKLAPRALVEVGSPAIVRGRRIVQVRFNPFQYEARSGRLTVVPVMDFALRFRGKGRWLSGREIGRLRPRFSDVAVDGMVANPGYAPSAEPAAAPQNGGADATGADYLIITADAFVEEIQPLADWKQRKGLRTKVVKLTDVGTTAAAVETYIQNAYDNWDVPPLYVLIVGDHDDVPTNDVGGYMSDHPYACVDGTDFLPDLTMGRLSVHTESEATTVVNKILTYDRDPDSGSWYDNALIAAYLQGPPEADRWFMETAMTVGQYLDQEQGMTVHHALTSPSSTEYNFRAGSYPHRLDIVSRYEPFASTSTAPFAVPTWISDMFVSSGTTEVSNAINGGVGLVQHRDHGGNTGWGDPHFYTSNVNALTNGVKTPVIFSINCLTGTFNYASGDCFAETFLKHPNGGAVGIMAASQLSYSGPNDLIVHGMYDCLYPDYDPTHGASTYPASVRPAEMMNYGKFYMYTYYGSGGVCQIEFNEFHWFGDPEMMLRTQTPATLSVQHDSAVPAHVATNFEVAVTSGGTPVAGARICVSRANCDDYYVDITDAAGRVTLANMTLTEIGDYDIVVTGFNLRPHEGTLESISSGPYADLVSPAEGSAVKVDQGYVHVRWHSPVGVGLSTATLDAADITIAGVTIGTPIAQGGAIWRYPYTGSLAQGTVTVNFVAGQVKDNSGDGNPAQTKSFGFDASGPVAELVTPAAGSTTTAHLGYVDVRWTDAGGSGLDEESLGADDVTIAGVTVIEAPTKISADVWRYSYAGTLARGIVNVTFPAGNVLDLADNDSAAGSESFTYRSPEIAVNPTSLNASGETGNSVNVPLTITNSGDASLTWSIRAQAAPENAEAAGNVLRQFSTPSEVGTPRGITFDGAHLWISNYTGTLYKLDPITGDLAGTVDVSAATTHAWGLSWDGSKLWIADSSLRKVYAVNPNTGAKLQTVDCPAGCSWYPTGVATSNGALWVMDYTANKIYKLNPDTGALLNTVTMAASCTTTYGLTMLNGAFWTSCYSSTTVRKLDAATGEEVGTFTGPDAYMLDYCSDGMSNLWAVSYINKKVYLLESGENGWLSATPQSGLIAAGGSQEVTITMDANELDPGVHQATLIVDSNDVDEPIVEIPVTFSVRMEGVILVKADATGMNDGSTWENAFTDLQDALALAESGDEIWVAAGTYKPTDDTDRTRSFAMKTDVMVCGGFVGTESTREQREPTANVCVLSGEIGLAGATDNSYHVVVGVDGATLDGFTISGGNANGAGNDGKGGGMHNLNSSPTIVKCVFDGNLAANGAGLWGHGSSSQISGCRFTSNTATYYGGGMYLGNSSVVLSNCIFDGNSVSSYFGGGIYSTASSLAVTNCTLSGNSAGRSGGGVACFRSSVAIMKNSVIWGNTAPSGSQLYRSGSSLAVSYSCVQGGYGGTGNISNDPLFAEADGGDHHLKSRTGRYEGGEWVSDTETSPCIDAGDPECPCSEEAEPSGGRINMGAYGNTPEASKRGSVVHYVDQAASGAENGSSWEDAHRYVQHALLAARDGDEVWVATGTYKPGSSRETSFQLKTRVAVYGGFAGVETQRDQRSPEANVTVLSGNVGLGAQTSDNCYHVIVGDTGATLDGFTISGGNADGSGNDGSGGGMLNVGASPTIVNCVFSENSASRGGGIYNNAGSPALSGCVFTGNTASTGGAVWTYNASPQMTNCIFNGNSATSYGGALFNNSASPSLKNCLIAGNTVSDYSGGGIYNTASSPTLTNCTLSGNSAKIGGAVANYSSSSLSVTNCILWGNSATSGAEIYSSSSTSVVSYSCVKGGYSGAGNISSDPGFANAADTVGLDGRFGTRDDGLVLVALSPCADAGTASGAPGIDIRGQARPQGGGVDMGAYEWVQSDTVIFVKAEASGTNDGTSWTDAYTDAQDALAAARSGHEIWVAAGTYKPTSDTDRTRSFTLRNGVAVYGGFAGNEAERAGRSPSINTCVLSGEIGTSGTGDNSYHVVVGATGAILDGFTVMLGNANGSGNDGNGGGLLNLGTSPFITDCIFEANIAARGGGVYNISGSPVMTRCRLTGNTATNGGGIWNHLSSVQLTNCIISNNSAASYGGGVYNSNSSPTATNCLFAGNSAPGIAGGGMYNNQASPILTNCTFSANSSSRGGAIASYKSTVMTLKNSIAWGNAATSGAQFHKSSSTHTVAYSCIQGGHAGIGNISSDPRFVAGGDYHLKSEGGHWTSTGWVNDAETSPCVDAGDPGSAYAKEAALNGDRVNMGAYGNTDQASKSMLPGDTSGEEPSEDLVVPQQQPEHVPEAF